MSLFEIVCWAWLAVGAVTLVALFFVRAPYGRYERRGWGPTVGATLGWILMELPAVLTIAVFFVLGGRHDAVSIAFLALWEAHYLHRTFVFPFRRRSPGRRTPLSIVAMAVVFNVVNGALNGHYLFQLGPVHGVDWLTGPAFLGGAALFVVGMAVNVHADSVLFNLRRPGETDYKIPTGGLYRFISCPNYFGEILEWTGFAIATLSPAAGLFAFWTVANLLPRAVAHHKWYRETFDDYPSERRALLPFLL